MSIALLTQVYDETRRLAIAGSVVAPGDFRIKKLVAPLEQAGAKAPVFAKVAEGIKTVVDATDKTSAQTLLDLATLVNAILYTQGEIGAVGDLEPIATTDLGMPATQTSARVLKPLLEALTSTGAGRLELIRDAHERGAFRDLRLIQPVVAAIDDTFGELADFVAERILPLYGKAILPTLRSSFDMKGRAGHPRRLRLIYQLDPTGSRDLVKQALENGSKEVKVAAIECLGSEREDISYLLEQATAKSQDIRQAAYRALATIDDDSVLAVLEKAFVGKDLNLIYESLSSNRNEKVLRFILVGIEDALVDLCKTKAKKDVSEKVIRLLRMFRCLEGRDDAASEELIMRVFADRNNLAKIKGESLSGSDLNAIVVSTMARGNSRLRVALIDKCATLDSSSLDMCFQAARCEMPAEKVFDLFSPYLTAKVDEKKKDRDPAYAKRSAILNHLLQQRQGRRQPDELPPLDPRWLDLAVQLDDLLLVSCLICPGDTGANVFLSKTFAKQFDKAKQMSDCHHVVVAMVRAEHPDAIDVMIAMLEKFGNESFFVNYFGHLIPSLPKSALARLEALIPKLHERTADSLLGFLQQLRDKK